MTYDVHQRVADAIAVGTIPANAAIWYWLDKADLLLRIGVSAGSLILIGFAIRAKIKHGAAAK
jgi:hypothetical protein